MKTYVYRIKSGGELRGLWNDSLTSLLGEMRTQRASHVEFCMDMQKWHVEIVLDSLAPCCLLEGYDRRGDALDAERLYLNELIQSNAVPALH